MPVINRSIDGFQFYAGSVPSGDVGGDLVDLIERDGNRWMAYLADVSGHGVAAGTLMGMFKTATRTRVMTPGTSLDRLLGDVNQVISGVKKPGMFVTCAFVEYQRRECMRFTTAGHPPILLHRRASGEIHELAVATGVCRRVRAPKSSTFGCGQGNTTRLLVEVLAPESCVGVDFDDNRRARTTVLRAVTSTLA